MERENVSLAVPAGLAAVHKEVALTQSGGLGGGVVTEEMLAVQVPVPHFPE